MAKDSQINVMNPTRPPLAAKPYPGAPEIGDLAGVVFFRWGESVPLWFISVAFRSMTKRLEHGSPTYKSPAQKLIRFFEGSRDKREQKDQESQRVRKKLSNQVRAVEKSRGHWRDVAREERQRAQQLEGELENLRRGV